MNKAYIFVLGGTSTITLSIFLFVLAPRIQVAAVDKEAISAQLPYTEAELKGRKTYIENGCVYCHSQQVRDPVAGADKHFGWGRASLHLIISTISRICSERCAQDRIFQTLAQGNRVEIGTIYTFMTQEA